MKYADSITNRTTDGSESRAAFHELRLGGKLKLSIRRSARLADPKTPATVDWRASVIVDGQTVDRIVSGYTTQVRVKSGKNAK